MITTIFLNIISFILSTIFSFLPTVTELPSIGGYSLDTIFITIFGYVHGMYTAFPPFEIVFQCLFFYYALKVTLLGLKFLLGHRLAI